MAQMNTTSTRTSTHQRPHILLTSRFSMPPYHQPISIRSSCVARRYSSSVTSRTRHVPSSFSTNAETETSTAYSWSSARIWKTSLTRDCEGLPALLNSVVATTTRCAEIVAADQTRRQFLRPKIGLICTQEQRF